MNADLRSKLAMALADVQERIADTEKQLLRAMSVDERSWSSPVVATYRARWAAMQADAQLLEKLIGGGK